MSFRPLTPVPCVVAFRYFGISRFRYSGPLLFLDPDASVSLDALSLYRDNRDFDIAGFRDSVRSGFLGYEIVQFRDF